jgi:hypothetical protein
MDDVVAVAWVPDEPVVAGTQECDIVTAVALHEIVSGVRDDAVVP